MSSASANLQQRLTGYWKLEAGNAVLLPAFLIMIAQWNPSWVSLISFIPMTLLLAIGAFYWRAKLAQLKDRAYDLNGALRIISILQMPALLLTLMACGIVGYAWSSLGVFTSGWDKGAATAAAVLAVLEYVNYYHRQLQHFDHWPDFQRLLAGKGLRASQMAKDLKTYRRT